MILVNNDVTDDITDDGDIFSGTKYATQFMTSTTFEGIVKRN